VKVSNWYSKIAQPVLTNLALDYGNVKTYDTYPRELPDLFSGSQLAVFGRYKADTAGKTTLKLSGDSGRGRRSFETKVNFPEVRAGTDYLASLWASRKIGFLVDQIRLHGKKDELVDEVIALSTKYGILTEYTAFLADEDEVVAAEEAPRLASEAMAGAFAKRGGAWATSQTQNAQRMRLGANVAHQNVIMDAAGNETRIANLQNRGQRGFVQREGQWQDMRYNAKAQQVALKVQAFSEAHFQISRAFPAVNQFLAVSDNMIVVLNGQAVQIGPEGKTELTDEELEALRAKADDEAPEATGAAPAGRRVPRGAPARHGSAGRVRDHHPRVARVAATTDFLTDQAHTR